MGCVIKYKGQSIPEEQFLQYLNKQIAINNLFNENENLANAVYEALGFTANINLETNLKNTGKTEQELIEYLKKKYPEIKLNISNNPVWEQGDNIFNQEMSKIQKDLEGLKLFTNAEEVVFYGICNKTAGKCFLHLRDKGFNPFPISADGSTISFITGAPVKGTFTGHYVSVVAINNRLYIYDMPQNQYLSGEHITDKDIEMSAKLIRNYGRSEGTGAPTLKITQPFTPFLIPLELEELKAQYNMGDLLAAEAIKSILHSGRDESGSYQILLPDYVTKQTPVSMETYIKQNIENGENYLTELKNQYESIIENAAKLEEQRRKQQKLNTIKEADEFLSTDISEKDMIKIRNFINHKIKLKSKIYLPKKATEFNYNLIVKNILGNLFNRVHGFTPSDYLKSLDIYLKSQDFIIDLFNQYKKADSNVYSKINEIEKLKNRKKEFNIFISKVAEIGLKQALSETPKNSFLQSISTLEKAKITSYKQEAAILVAKYKDTKKFLKLLEADKNTYDLLQELYQNIKVREKYSTLLNYLQVNNKNTDALYAYIQNEIIRQYKHFSKTSDIEFQKDEFDKIIGQANIKALTVLVDAVNKKADTIPHEYVHHYITWFRDSAIVQEGIKRFGSEEALVQAIGEQVILQKGEAYNWWKKFTNFILNLLSDKQVLQILTDSFLNRTDLNNDFTYNQITPQQKQQAQQLYSQYLSQNPNGSVEEFKSWVDGNQSNVQYQLPQEKLNEQVNNITSKYENEIKKIYDKLEMYSSDEYIPAKKYIPAVHLIQQYNRDNNNSNYELAIKRYYNNTSKIVVQRKSLIESKENNLLTKDEGNIRMTINDLFKKVDKDVQHEMEIALKIRTIEIKKVSEVPNEYSIMKVADLHHKELTKQYGALEGTIKYFEEITALNKRFNIKEFLNEEELKPFEEKLNDYNANNPGNSHFYQKVNLPTNDKRDKYIFKINFTKVENIADQQNTIISNIEEDNSISLDNKQEEKTDEEIKQELLAKKDFEKKAENIKENIIQYGNVQGKEFSQQKIIFPEDINLTDTQKSMLMNFDTHFPNYSFLTLLEKTLLIEALGDGDITMYCNI